ncbi:hypothetical protein MtrunA17_Chr1g0180961 [Medicago truncatula]|uniref:Transmembrane protein n=1 Tax=Medicago truncatula TaxID=3880 RepID=A0A396JSL0_MEDTR|nr:hypothetical protein MtrunA17_Chr1g0180961 [Medicago truncatula]
MRNCVSCIVLFLLSLSLLPKIHSAPSFFTDEIYKELKSIAVFLNQDIKSSLSFCIKDPYVYIHLFK